MHHFSQRLQQLPPTILTAIAEIDELKGRWIGGAQLNPQTLARLKQSVLVTSTGASTRIEGARLSDADVEKPSDRSRRGTHAAARLDLSLVEVLATTIMRTSSSNVTRGRQPRSALGLEGSYQPAVHTASRGKTYSAPVYTHYILAHYYADCIMQMLWSSSYCAHAR